MHWRRGKGGGLRGLQHLNFEKLKENELKQCKDRTKRKEKR